MRGTVTGVDAEGEMAEEVEGKQLTTVLGADKPTDEGFDLRWVQLEESGENKGTSTNFLGGILNLKETIKAH